MLGRKLMPQTTAEVQVLTAEVRVLMVGSRQVTLSVYRQLDSVDPEQIEAFGGVRDQQDKARQDECCVVGRGRDLGDLVRSRVAHTYSVLFDEPPANISDKHYRWYCSALHMPGSAFTVLSDDGDIVKFPRPQTGLLGYHCYEHNRTEYRSHPSPPEDFDRESVRAALERTARHRLERMRVEREYWSQWTSLPLIVLAGLR
jgi:hypothetical protein